MGLGQTVRKRRIDSTAEGKSCLSRALIQSVHGERELFTDGSIVVRESERKWGKKGLSKSIGVFNIGCGSGEELKTEPSSRTFSAFHGLLCSHQSYEFR